MSARKPPGNPRNPKGLRTIIASGSAVVALIGAFILPLSLPEVANAQLSAGYSTAVFKKTPTPKIEGIAEVGSWLTVIPGTWDPGVKLSIQWKRNYIFDIKGQTNSRYLVTSADLGKKLTVSVTGTKKGFVTYEASSAEVIPFSKIATPAPSAKPSISPSPTPSPTAALGKLTNTPIPAVVGNAVVGAELKAIPGNWDSGVQLSYQWYRGSTPILGATSAKYVAVALDSGFPLKVVVTGSKANFSPVERTSGSTKPVTAGTAILQDIPISAKPVVNGVAQVGQNLSLETGSWTSGVSLSIQWLRNGLPISGATSTSYKLIPLDLNAKISASVTGSMAGYKSLTIASDPSLEIAAATFSESGALSIYGVASVGSSLSLSLGVWDKAARLEIKWFVDGSEIVGETGLTFSPRASDLGKVVSATVKATAPGYRTENKSVTSSTPVSMGLISPAPNPNISGSSSVGSILTANPGVWLQGVTFNYQWLRDGAPISGATTSTYKIVASDIGAILSVAVTGSKPAFQPLTKTVTFNGQIPTSVFPSTPAPKIKLLSGRTYSLDTTLDWGSDTQFTYQWLRNNAEITNATSLTYVATAEDSGQNLTLKVTGSKAGFTSVSSTSQPVVVPFMNFTKYNMSISWPNDVGNTIGALPDFDSGTNFTYQWTRDGSPIAGETQSTYLVKISDAGHSIGFTFTASKPGFNSRTGSVTEQRVPLIIVSTPVPTITGSPYYFSTLTANPGVWDDGVTLTYEWYSDFDGPGPFSSYAPVWLNNQTSRYTGSQTANGRYFYVCVTGRKAALKPVEKCSEYFGPMQNNVFPNQPALRILGTPGYGATLSVDTSGWLPGSRFTYAWTYILDGKKFSGGTGETYSRWDASWWGYLSRKIQLKLEVSKDGYETVTLQSAELSF